MTQLTHMLSRAGSRRPGATFSKASSSSRATAAAYFERFGVLLFLAVVIATMGILGDSTATVIGAMIVAPLMTPIMATAAALVAGRMDRAGRSPPLVVAGVVGVVGLAWIFGAVQRPCRSTPTVRSSRGRARA